MKKQKTKTQAKKNKSTSKKMAVAKSSKKVSKKTVKKATTKKVAKVATKKTVKKKVVARLRPIAKSKATAKVKVTSKKMAPPKITKKIGLFGGTFNPFHRGHLQSLKEIFKQAKLSEIYVIPSFQNPFKAVTDGPTPEQRLEMVKLGLQNVDAPIYVDDIEIKRGGTTYSVDTIKEYGKKYSKDQLYFIVGADVLEGLSRWKDSSEIFKGTNFIVTTRPGFYLPQTREELPLSLQPYIKSFSGKTAKLTSGRSLQFIEIPDAHVSATDVRKKIRAGQPFEHDVPQAVAEFVAQNGLYKDLNRKITDFAEFSRECAQVLFDKKAVNLKGYDLSKENGLTDYAIIASGTSTRHTASLAENLIQTVKEQTGIRPISIEGLTEGRWVLVDYGALIIHIFYDFVRQEYRLEDLWRRGIDMNMKDRNLPSDLERASESGLLLADKSSSPG